jgi:FkbM family methyltransferase
MQSTSHRADPYMPAQLDVLVHMGAGRCRELDSHLAAKPKKVLLIEADPQLAEALEARTADLPHVQVTRAAVAGERRAAEFHRYNLPDAGSLQAASGLLELFPGLRTLERITVETISAPELIGPLRLDTAQENLLVVDVPAEELPVLQALQQAEQLHLFRHLHVHCGRESLYERSQPASSVVQWLRDHGFDLIDEDDSNDPDRPRLILQRNALALQNRALSLQLIELRRELEEVAAARDVNAKLLREKAAQIDQLSRSQGEAAGRVEALLKQLEIAQADAANLKAECGRQVELINKQVEEIDRLTKSRDQAMAHAETLKKRLESAELEVNKVATERDQHVKRLTDQFATERAQLEQVAAALKEELSQSKKLVEDRTKQLSDVTAAKTAAEKLADTLQQKVKRLETENAEITARQRIMNEELVKGEAQIELIKDLLLREPGL